MTKLLKDTKSMTKLLKDIKSMTKLWKDTKSIPKKIMKRYKEYNKIMKRWKEHNKIYIWNNGMSINTWILHEGRGAALSPLKRDGKEYVRETNRPNMSVSKWM